MHVIGKAICQCTKTIVIKSAFIIAHGVVQCTVHLRSNNALDKVNGVIYHSMDLRDATHSVGVLNTRAVLMTLCVHTEVIQCTILFAI